ncbi:MAG: translation initiation factor IF-6 [Thermoplasmata archaeon]|nr:translation initiation factor IF-6 [Euryarchaeota archaeon]RLF66888.1 MAG: translation initiation factor IF-6 [Thermoplasmata archaeon]
MGKITLLNFHKNPFLGIFGKANDEWLIVARGVPLETIKKAKEALDVDVIEITIGGTSLVGSLLVLNSKGIVVSNIIYEDELKILEEIGLEVAVAPGKENAVGNVVLVDDKAALVDPELDEETVNVLEDVLKVKVYRGTIGDSGLVGMSAVINKYGILCHPDLSDNEEKLLKEIFGEDRTIDVGTVNRGTPFVGSGIIANSKGVIVGDRSTGVELMRIESTLLP